MYRVEYTTAAARELDRLARRAPTADVRAITAAVDRLEVDPRPPGVLKLAGGDDLLRIRVREYRVIYLVDDSAALVVVTRVARRGEATYRP